MLNNVVTHIADHCKNMFRLTHFVGEEKERIIKRKQFARLSTIYSIHKNEAIFNRLIVPAFTWRKNGRKSDNGARRLRHNLWQVKTEVFAPFIPFDA